jgi:hypothetical protein
MQLIPVLFTLTALLTGPILLFAPSDSADVEIGSMKVEGSIRTRVYGWDWFRRASASVYYGYADGKSVIQHIYPRDPNGQPGFLELSYRF